MEEVLRVGAMTMRHKTSVARPLARLHFRRKESMLVELYCPNLRLWQCRTARSRSRRRSPPPLADARAHTTLKHAQALFDDEDFERMRQLFLNPDGMR